MGSCRCQYVHGRMQGWKLTAVLAIGSQCETMLSVEGVSKEMKLLDFGFFHSEFK